MTATGNVRIDRLGDIVTGDQATFDLKTESGYIDKPTYRFRQFHARGHADKLISRIATTTSPSTPPIPTATSVATIGT